MNEVRSINQNIHLKLLPSFRNIGTVLRIVLLTNGLGLLGAMAQASSLAQLQEFVLQGSALLQPVLLCSLLALYLLDPMLEKVPPLQGALAVTVVVTAITLVLDMLEGELLAYVIETEGMRYTRHALVAIALTQVLLAYFRLRAQALVPAKQEARLQALQARIRPHFLFNTINAVLSIVRNDPKRAETALEDMADLFRMAMVEPHELVPLNEEIALARQYLSIESLRLGERLQVQWDTRAMPQDALIPPLMLQPLLENAVYHGIEPLPEGGIIKVKLFRDGDELHLQVSNPAVAQAGAHTNGNRIALANIRERLALLFDVEAQYQVEQGAEQYRVQIVIPYLKGQSE